MVKLSAIKAMAGATMLMLAAAVPAAAQGFDHALFDSVLTRFVQDSRVDYAALKQNRGNLDRYVSRVAAVTPQRFAGWTEAERVAFLINAYNAYVLRTVIDNYPIQGSSFFKKLTAPKRFAFPRNSIRHIDGVFDGIKHEVAGEEMTLDEIEHGHLRAEYAEPRIHFALVCAAVSCPPLRQEAFRGDRLDQQLDEQGLAFMNDPRLNRFEIEGKRVHLSKILDWFGEDFEAYAVDSGYSRDSRINGVLSFVSRYLPERVVDFLEKGDYRVQVESYDWTLNDQAVAASGG